MKSRIVVSSDVFLDAILDAFTQLNKRVCPSVGALVGPLVTRFFFYEIENV